MGETTVTERSKNYEQARNRHARPCHRTYVRDDFEVRALDDVSLQIRAQSFAAIKEPSGSGKTTMLNRITGIDHPKKRGKRLEPRNGESKRISIVPSGETQNGVEVQRRHQGGDVLIHRATNKPRRKAKVRAASLSRPTAMRPRSVLRSCPARTPEFAERNM